MSTQTIAVIDYGMGNLRSVSKALEHVASHDWQLKVSNKPDGLCHADKIVFPGQGAIGNCMTLLNQGGLADAIKQTLEDKLGKLKEIFDSDVVVTLGVQKKSGRVDLLNCERSMKLFEEELERKGKGKGMLDETPSYFG